MKKVTAKAKTMKLDSDDESSGEEEKPATNRKEREAAAAEAKKQAYLQATREGKTPEAQKDLQRLQELRAKREAAERRKKQEAEEKEHAALEKKRIAINGGKKAM